MRPAGVRVSRFRWLPDGTIPQAWDLREVGWVLVAPGNGDPASIPVLCDHATAKTEIHGTTARAATIVLGVDDSLGRARKLALGFGDAVPSSATLEEIEQRALRLSRTLDALPRRRQHGPLELDLVLRDGLIGSRRLGLHPREFGLLWRLAREPGRPVSAEELISEVWQMNFRPETNSLAVHVCRLRAKLASAGLSGVIGTTSEGGYTLTGIGPVPERLAEARAIPEVRSRTAMPGGRRKIGHEG